MAISGRIFSIRSSGKRLRFLDLHQNEARVQIKADSKEYDQEFEKFDRDFDTVRRGDVVGVSGFPCRTKTGELSIIPTVGGFQILSPCLRILPSGTLEKPEHRFRRRYLDLVPIRIYIICTVIRDYSGDRNTKHWVTKNIWLPN